MTTEKYFLYVLSVTRGMVGWLDFNFLDGTERVWEKSEKFFGLVRANRVSGVPEDSVNLLSRVKSYGRILFTKNMNINVIFIFSAAIVQPRWCCLQRDVHHIWWRKEQPTTFQWIVGLWSQQWYLEASFACIFTGCWTHYDLSWFQVVCDRRLVSLVWYATR